MGCIYRGGGSAGLKLLWKEWVDGENAVMVGVLVVGEPYLSLSAS
jgi:hypothetical protein